MDTPLFLRAKDAALGAGYTYRGSISKQATHPQMPATEVHYFDHPSGHRLDVEVGRPFGMMPGWLEWKHSAGKTGKRTDALRRHLLIVHMQKSETTIADQLIDALLNEG